MFISSCQSLQMETLDRHLHCSSNNNPLKARIGLCWISVQSFLTWNAGLTRLHPYGFLPKTNPPNGLHKFLFLTRTQALLSKSASLDGKLKTQTPARQKRLWEPGGDGEQRNTAKLWITFQFTLVHLCHRGTGVHLGRGRGWRISCGLCLSCCYCCCRFCMVMGRSWAGSQIYQAVWGSRWLCRRWSAGVASGRS